MDYTGHRIFIVRAEMVDTGFNDDGEFPGVTLPMPSKKLLSTTVDSHSYEVGQAEHFILESNYR